MKPLLAFLLIAGITPAYAAPMTQEACLKQSYAAERYYRAASGWLSWNRQRHMELNRRSKCNSIPKLLRCVLPSLLFVLFNA